MSDVLVVDDQPDLREVVALALATVGHTVTETASGLEATRLAAQRYFDVVVLDVDPEALQGMAVARVIADLGTAPVIAVSGRADEWAREMLAAGAAACLPKPFSIGELLSLVTSVLRSGGAREGRWAPDVLRLSREDLTAAASLSRDALDALPFGAIALDRDGRIVEYNEYEQDASQHERSRVLGMRFTDLAPCTVVRKFARRVDQGLRGEPLDAVLRFVFPHGRALSVVSVRLYRDDARDRVWVFVSKRPTATLEPTDRPTLEAASRIPGH